ncbi:MAG: D-amino-acid transaminase [Hyphomonadaceae bacterium]|nr:D-amino-acid transaminase [Hyphomonadaceae bacterium]
MSIAYVNGAYVPLGEAGVHIEDRGFQFGDAIYEVWGVRSGRLFDTDGHLARLHRSLNELRIRAPMTDSALMAVVRETQRRNRVRDGLIYLQISRGAAPRDHVFPPAHVQPTLVITAKRMNPAVLDARARYGVKVITVPEVRWARRDIKSVNLLPNVLARQQASEVGAFEAWFVEADGSVTEGTSSNAWIVDAEGCIRTRALSNQILHGVTRAALMRIAAERQMRLAEAPFSVAEAKAAREAFISSATNPAVAVVSIDGVPIGDGRPGPVAQALRAAYFGAA